MSKDRPVPLVVLDRSGNVRDVPACNAKSRAKSLEQNELWILRPDNGRVLPFLGGGVRCSAFTRGGEELEWYRVTVDLDGARATTTEDASGSTQALPREAPAAEPAPAADPASKVDATIPILTSLADLIAERHRTLPEGSYTTHLFSRGPSKIRKKTGEEAVELILAENRDEIVAEAADLLYHAMVLLESEGVRIEEVLRELARRHGESG